jgi:Domain of unknown function (DUF4190)
MALLLNCKCGAQFEVDEAWAGKTISCPDCRQSIAVPPLPKPSQPTNACALLSLVLALVGAFTLVGSALAVGVGLVALAQIARQRDKAPGAGFAVFGIVAGLLGTAVTAAALRHADLFGLGTYFHAIHWDDKVDYDGDLEFVSPDGKQGFRIKRLSREWGVVRERRGSNGILDGLQIQPPAALFKLKSREAFVDVTIDQVNNLRPLTEYQDNFLADLTRERPDEGDRFEPRRGNGARISSVNVRKGREGTTLKVGDNEFLEFVVDLRCGDQAWSMLVRLCRTRDNRLFTLRGFARQQLFTRIEDDLKKFLDTFRTTP